jgi:hypothetical protein
VFTVWYVNITCRLVPADEKASLAIVAAELYEGVAFPSTPCWVTAAYVYDDYPVADCFRVVAMRFHQFSAHYTPSLASLVLHHVDLTGDAFRQRLEVNSLHPLCRTRLHQRATTMLMTRMLQNPRQRKPGSRSRHPCRSRALLTARQPVLKVAMTLLVALCPRVPLLSLWLPHLPRLH